MTPSRPDDLYLPAELSEDDLEYVAKSGLGRQFDWTRECALLVVDMTEEFTSDEYAAGRSDTGARALTNTERVLSASRDVGIPIYFTTPHGTYPEEYQGVWVEKKYDPPTESRPGNDIPADIAPAEGEVVIEKGKPSAFFGTHLADMLRYRSVETVIVTGMTTSGCIRATVTDACSHNFKPIVPHDCVADRAELSHEVNLFEMDFKYANVVDSDDVIEQLEELYG